MNSFFKGIIDQFFHEEHLEYDIAVLLVVVALLVGVLITVFIYNRKLKQVNQSLKEMSETLVMKNRILEETATNDKMTGIKNRTYFDQRLLEEMAAMDRYGGELTLLFFDLDLFKNVNDSCGHDVGDAVLVRLSEAIQKLMRKSDLFARWGGEEFVVLLSGTALEGAEKVAEKIRITAEALEHPGVGTVTVSIGVSQRHKGENQESWFKRTDSALYRAKAEGRNRVSINHYLEGYIYMEFKWQSRYESGHAEIDNQHKMLFYIGNELMNATLNEYNKEVLIEKMDSLMEHVVNHFKYEEEVLRSIAYNEYEEHRKIHGQLVRKARELRAHLIKDRISPIDAFDFVVVEIILNHLTHEDVNYFQYTKA